MRTKIEVNCLTGETIERPYTDEENAQAEIDEAAAEPEPETEDGTP